MPWQSDVKYIWTLKHPETKDVVQATFYTEEDFLKWKAFLEDIDNYIERAYGSK